MWAEVSSSAPLGVADEEAEVPTGRGRRAGRDVGGTPDLNQKQNKKGISIY